VAGGLCPGMIIAVHVDRAVCHFCLEGTHNSYGEYTPCQRIHMVTESSLQRIHINYRYTLQKTQ
jgi:hypothetical protein